MERGEPTARTGDQTATSRQRYTVAEAAELLDTSVEGVRGRIKRGTLEGVKDGGTVYVLLSPDQVATGSRPADNQSADQPRPDPLVDELRDRIAFLEGQLQGREEELRRRDAILMNMTEAMKAIGPPRQDASESPEPRSSTGSPTEDTGEPETATERPEERSWWRRMFGGS